MISLSKDTSLIILIWLMSLLSVVHCEIEYNYVELNCTITASEQDVNGIYHNDTRNISAVNRCDEGYENVDIIIKCENLINPALPMDSDLFSPVTNSITNVTYWNKFCATCNNNNETELIMWPPWPPYFGLSEFPCEDHASEIQRSDVDDLGELTRIFINKGMKLSSKIFGERELECSIEENWPIHLLNRTLPCLVHNFGIGQNSRLNSCQYVEKNCRICTKMRLFIEGYRNDTWSALSFTPGEYIVESGYEDVFYFCQQPEMVIYNVGNLGKIIISFISTIFLSIYLALNLNKRCFENFSNKIMFSYSIGVMVMHVLLTFFYLWFPVPCVGFYLAQFSWIFHMFWTKIIIAEFFHLIYYACKKRDVDTKSQYKRYLICSILGFVVPAILPLMYFIILETHDNQCPLIPDHLGVTCNYAKDSNAEFYMKILILILFKNIYIFMPLLFFLAHVCVLVYVTKCGPNGLKSTINTDHVIVLIKMSLIMAFHWILHRICVWYGLDHLFTIFGLSMNIYTVTQLSIDLHGVLVFLVFGFENSLLVKILNKCGCKCKTVSEKSGSDVTGTTVQFQSS